MAEEKEDLSEKYDNMSRKDLESIAKEVTGMEDNNERHLHTLQAIKGYTQSDTVEAEHREPIIELMAGSKAEKMQGIYKGLHDAHVAKKDDLDHTVTTEWLKKFADTIMPTMKVGVEGESDQNYNHLVKFYLTENDTMTGRNRGETLDEVRKLIAKGNGFEASAMIIRAIKNVKRSHEMNNFMEFLIPPDHYEFKDAAAKKIADDVNGRPENKGGKYEVSWKIISQNLVPMYRLYINNKTEDIIKNAQIKKSKPTD